MPVDYDPGRGVIYGKTAGACVPKYAGGQHISTFVPYKLVINGKKSRRSETIRLDDLDSNTRCTAGRRGISLNFEFEEIDNIPI